MRVRRGGEITVLDRDTPIARIVPFSPRERGGPGRARGRDDYWTSERIDELERQGVVKRGDAKRLTAWLGEHRPVKMPKGSPSVVDLMVRMRRESTR
jgi:antitoxin (DNA-binding transcriptional repressor) of toxin-antitoxin stability system